jgi:four helix bundle protein
MAVDFRDLRVWEEAMQLAEEVYALTTTFPQDERFGLTSQIRRAGVSVASCIAEGNGRETTRDYLRFLAMANGSLAELRTHLLLSERLAFGDSERLRVALKRVASVGLLLQALRKSLKVKLPLAPHSPFPVPRSRST